MNKRQGEVSFSKILFALLGGMALIYVVQDYGLGRLLDDIRSAGWFSLLLVLTFVPTLLCYSLAWMLCTDLGSNPFSSKNIWNFTRMSASSIAWNNLTPFLKVGGEPAKYFMLAPYVGKKKAMRSVVVYNAVHIVGTLGAIILAFLLIPFVYDVDRQIGLICLGLGVLTFALTAFLFSSARLKWLLSLFQKSRTSVRFLRKVFLGLRWSVSKTERFLRFEKRRFLVGVALEIFARFVEGLTFYLAFLLIGKPITVLTAAFLDVGRTIFDTIFFFIPYQVGSREGSMLFMMRDVFQISSAGYLTSVFMYRFVEIVWIFLGYLFWIRMGSSVKFSRVAAKAVVILGCFLGAAQVSAEGFDYKFDLSGRTRPFGGVVTGTLGYGKLLWGEKKKGDFLYGYLRPNISMSTSTVTYRPKASLEFFPISILGFYGGVQHSHRLVDTGGLDCTIIECRGGLNGVDLGGILLLGVGSLYFGGSFTSVWLTPTRLGRPFSDEVSSLAGVAGGDRLSRINGWLGYQIDSEFDVGYLYMRNEMEDFGSFNNNHSLYYRVKRKKWSTLIGAGVYESTTQDLGFSMIFKLTWIGIPGLYIGE